MEPLAADANLEQAEFWNSEEAKHWVLAQDRYDRMLAPFGVRVLESAGLLDGERVLDVGCGTGAMTCGAAGDVSTGGVLGLDISRSMIDAARARAASASVDNARFEIGDAQVYPFGSGSIDAAISRFGVMFFTDPVAAFANVRGALASDGRFVFVCWQDLLLNEWMAVPAMAALQHVPPPKPPAPGAPGPFSFGDRNRLRDTLRASGFSEIAIDPVDEPVLLGGGGSLDDTITYLRSTGMARALLSDATSDTTERAMDSVRSALEPYSTSEGVRLGSAAWLVHAKL